MVIYNREDLNSNLDCPYCEGKKMFTNGCGGKGMKFVNKMLGILPSSKLFYGPCCLHDVVYALVCVEPIQVRYPNGVLVTLHDREDCDNLWYREMQDMCQEVKWFKGVMIWAARRNYEIVREEGGSFFKHDH